MTGRGLTTGGGVGGPPVRCLAGRYERGAYSAAARGAGVRRRAGSPGRTWIRPPVAGRVLPADPGFGRPRPGGPGLRVIRVVGPEGRSRLRYFVRFCPGVRVAVSVIEGHRGRISPLLTHDNSRAALRWVVCSILRGRNGRRRCLSPLHPRSRWRAGGMTLGAACRGNRRWAMPARDTPRTHLSAKRSHIATCVTQSGYQPVDPAGECWQSGANRQASSRLPADDRQSLPIAVDGRLSLRHTLPMCLLSRSGGGRQSQLAHPIGRAVAEPA